MIYIIKNDTLSKKTKINLVHSINNNKNYS